MYEAMTSAYNSGNARDNNRNEGKRFKYTLLDKGFKPTSSGICTDVIKRYDPCFDFNIVSFTDTESGKRFSVCQFYIKMQSIAE